MIRWFRQPHEAPLNVPKPVAVRRIRLTLDEVRAGRRSWLRVDTAGTVEAVMHFDSGPSYAAAMPEQLSRDVYAWLDAAMFALEPLLAEDVEGASR